MRCFALLLIVFASCKKDEVTRIDFSQFTRTDVNGQATGHFDSTDWVYDATWTARELALMNFDDAVVFTDSASGTVELSPAFPNPNNGLFAIGITTQQACKLKIVCINEQWQILYYHTRLLTGGPIGTVYDFRGNTSFDTNANYRLYYGFYNAADSLYYKGHGDVRIE